MEYDRPRVGVGVVIRRAGKILLGMRAGSHGAGLWALPGGFIEGGETFEETTCREVYEETGLTNLLVQGLISISNDCVYDKHFVSIGMLADCLEGEPVVMEPHKSRNWKWFNLEELPEDIFLPSKRVLENWKKGIVYTKEHE
ncbi:NUDIX domain-containing protein [Patescibacteria group bacterium]|nr:NUDIX domain-containing protein [Patescibacteria group bacterium]MBU1500854.1 NUDIX domain-containing protein [Patescibacteria group bacterium]MBU2080909.1 NUDIX domain-containing protein [Patescibacteria group bacterium]MBU2124014.1 NUDIX domain-containing protein [Patescibacteria group bacterium]MBU2194695.1 NUDIX domain-containing protein [Patescibacteria group bacterium]